MLFSSGTTTEGIMSSRVFLAAAHLVPISIVVAVGGYDFQSGASRDFLTLVRETSSGISNLQILRSRGTSVIGR